MQPDYSALLACLPAKHIQASSKLGLRLAPKLSADQDPIRDRFKTKNECATCARGTMSESFRFSFKTSVEWRRFFDFRASHRDPGHPEG
jgi:hypothetical protein